MLIEEDEGKLTLFLRHFRRGLGTSEKAPMKFRLDRLDKTTVVFKSDAEGLHFDTIAYRLEGPDTLVVQLSRKQGDRPVRIESRMKKTAGY
jgi:hypothetical protein